MSSATSGVLRCCAGTASTEAGRRVPSRWAELRAGGALPRPRLRRRGRALGLKGDFEEAEPDLRRAAELEPSLAGEVEKEVAAVRQRAKQAAAKQKSTFKNFFDR